jgi:hypothetical protein
LYGLDGLRQVIANNRTFRVDDLIWLRVTDACSECQQANSEKRVNDFSHNWFSSLMVIVLFRFLSRSLRSWHKANRRG